MHWVISFITPQVNFCCISQQSLTGNNLICLLLPFTTGNRWGFPTRRSTVKLKNVTSLEIDSINGHSDEIPELSPVILVKIYFYFASDSFLR